LGERLNGIQEVGGSIPPGSTNLQKAALQGAAFVFWGGVSRLKFFSRVGMQQFHSL
jgi:hypothetical protein